MALTTFKVFSLDTWSSWEKSGKLEVLKKSRQSIKDKNDLKKNILCTTAKDCDDSISRILYEIVGAIVRGLLKKDQGQPVLMEIISWHHDIPSVLTEILSLVEVEVGTIDRLAKQKNHLLSLIKSLSLDRLFCERLEIETLEETGIIKNRKNFLTKQIKMRTKLYYKQQKFNLLREESEGYSKLITELNQDLSESVNSKSIIHVIRSLIGCFNLDPNRVLDLILEAYEGRPEEHKFFTELLQEFPHESLTITEILRFKLHALTDSNEDSKDLFILMGLLARSNILTLDEVYSMLTPDDSIMVQEHGKWSEDAKLFCRRSMIVSTKDKEENDGSNDKDEKPSFHLKQPNRKIQFLVALLQMGNWDHFVTICSKFPNYYITSCEPVAQALANLIHYLVEPLCRQYSELPRRLNRKPYSPEHQIVMTKPVKSFDDLVTNVFPMISALGPYIYCDVRLMFKLLRLCKVALKRSNGSHKVPHSSEYYEILTILSDSLLPAVSMMECNPCIAEEVWDTIKHIDYQHRYKLYDHWKNESHKEHPALMVNRITALKKIKQITKRVTKETVKQTSRHLGKISHNFPGPVLEYVLKQVQLYDNMIGPIVDSFKCLTSLSFDVLAFCIVEIFCVTTERIQDDGLAISRLLQSLSNFSGSVCKKYPFDLSGLLQYVANQLKCEKSIDLLLLKDIVQKMGGAEFIDSPSGELLDAMSGGEILRKEAGQYLQEKNTKRSSLRLKEVLLENNLAIPLLLLMAQQRSCISYSETETPHLKLVGNLYDQCQSTMVQFGTFISQVVTIDELNSKLPPIFELLSEYHIDTDVAFFLVRPLLSHLLQNKYDELRKRDRNEKKLAVEDRKNIFIDACREIFLPIAESIKPHYTPKYWVDIDANFFMTFWTLSMSDLEVPVNAYDKEIQKLAELPTSRTRKKEVEKINALKEKLEEEKKRQLEHVERVCAWLTKEKDHWFKWKTRSLHSDSIISFLQNCVFPRCKFTTLDAIYCARFIRLLHDLKTPSFSTLLYLDRLFIHTSYTLISCTEQEAQHYARFLLEILETVKRWHHSKHVFDKECSKRPGFMTRYRQLPSEENKYIDYEGFRTLVHKWHYKIAKAMANCLESGDFIQIRNAIYILQGILPCFPVITNVYAIIEKRIDKVLASEKDKRRDLHVLASSYSGRLKSRKQFQVQEGDFHNTPARTKIADPKANSDVKTKKEPALNGNDENHAKTSSPDLSKVKMEKRSLESDGENHVSRAEKKRKEKKEDKSKDEKPKKKKELKKKLTETSDDASTPTPNGSSKVIPPDDEATKGTKRRKVDSEIKQEPKSPAREELRSKKRKTPLPSPEPESSLEKKMKKERKTASPEPKRRATTRKSQRT